MAWMYFLLLRHRLQCRERMRTRKFYYFVTLPLVTHFPVITVLFTFSGIWIVYNWCGYFLFCAFLLKDFPECTHLPESTSVIFGWKRNIPQIKCKFPDFLSQWKCLWDDCEMITFMIVFWIVGWWERSILSNNCKQDIFYSIKNIYWREQK